MNDVLTFWHLASKSKQYALDNVVIVCLVSRDDW